ncbi:MAG: MASE1 domain-containing protein [Methylococcaceae bacterium]|nr:MASE1 domain-containing protein [Methylococcaceae bacterium]
MKDLQIFLWNAGVFLLYFATAKVGLEYTVIGQTVTLLWLPSGIALVAVLIGGYRLWPGIALGALIANAGTGVPVITLSVITLGDTLEPLFGALLLRRWNNFSLALDRVSDVLALILLAAFGSTIVGATFGTLGLIVGEEITFADFGLTWLAWWLGDGMGVLVISPVLLAGFSMAGALPTRFSSKKALEAFVLIITLSVVGQTIFGNPKFAGLDYFPISLSIFPFVIWSALRFGTIGAASVALITSLLAINGTVQGTGPFAGNSSMNSLFLWCLFADLMAITGLILAAVDSGRKQAVAALRVSNEILDSQVQERTGELLQANLELHAALAERWRLQMEMNQISEERQKMIGQELHDGLGQQLTGIAFLVSSLSDTLGAKAAPEEPIMNQVKNLLCEAMSVIRSLSRGLYPVALETGGLSSALQHLAEYAKMTSGVECSHRVTASTIIVDKAIALNLYRIAQEAVCNSLRHSQAQRIEIKLSEAGEQYMLSIEDNGIGLPDQSKNKSSTLGLRSMRCRADLIGAAIEVRETPGCGTSIVVTGTIKYKE